MTSDSLRTLFHPFDTGLLEAPGQSASVLFLDAEPGFRPPEGFAAGLHLVQGFRASFRALEAAGHAVTPQIPARTFDAALILASRYRGQNERRLAEALSHVVPGGLIVFAGGKEDGVASLRKRVAAIVDIEGNVPKYHGLAFWLRRPVDTAASIAALRVGNGETVIERRYRTAPGMFSHDRVDPGSRLLVENLPQRLPGAVADFCAGWGYVAAEAARRVEAIASLDLYEADFASLEQARGNLAEAAGRMDVGFFWHDLAAEKVARRYEAILMNPPFHQGRSAEPGLGQKMIAAAAAALKPGGRLFMVANRGLPYDQALAAAFSDVSELARDSAFRVFQARR